VSGAEASSAAIRRPIFRTSIQTEAILRAVAEAMAAIAKSLAVKICERV
jgi:hypothetical protein